MWRGLRAAGVVAVLLAGAGDADAYVRYQSAMGTPFALMPACLPVPIVVYPGTFSQMTMEEVRTAAMAAPAAWSAGANPCTFLEFAVTIAGGPEPVASFDRRHTITLRNSSWCDLDSTGTCSAVIGPYDPAALAVTTVVASSSTGAIADADIEINAFHFPWADRVAHPELTDRHDLQNALTHEVGHALGFDHSCYNAAGAFPRPNDHGGQPVPDCATAPASVSATTMFPSAVPGDVERRTLAPDDQAGLCAVYPAASPCPPGTDGGCLCPTPDADGGQDAGGLSADAQATDAPTTDASNVDAPTTDAPTTDASPTDAGKVSSGGGCGCDAAGLSPPGPWLMLLILLGLIRGFSGARSGGAPTRRTRPAAARAALEPTSGTRPRCSRW